MKIWNKLQHEKYTAVIYEPEVYVDNKARGRSGHMSHALTEFLPNTIIDFNSNCSPVRCNGHSAYGWIEYKISTDAGVTYSESRDFPYSVKSLEDGIYTISVEKAVTCDDGTVVAFCLKNDMLFEICCQPWFTPSAVRSTDGCKTWEEPIEVSPFDGRIYDARYHNGVIYAYEFCNSSRNDDGTMGDWTGNKPEHLYRIFTSTDNGKTFSEHCVVPFESTHGRAYGAMIFDDNGVLHCYAYDINNEENMDHIISKDFGKTWEKSQKCYVAKGIRNPQVNIIDGVFVLQGRGSKGKSFVMYTSLDGQNWDEGVYLETEKGACYYSNSIVVNDPDGGKRLLVQFSDTFEAARVNVMHMWVKIMHNS